MLLFRSPPLPNVLFWKFLFKSFLTFRYSSSLLYYSFLFLLIHSISLQREGRSWWKTRLHLWSSYSCWDDTESKNGSTKKKTIFLWWCEITLYFELWCVSVMRCFVAYHCFSFSYFIDEMLDLTFFGDYDSACMQGIVLFNNMTLPSSV